MGFTIYALVTNGVENLKQCGTINEAVAISTVESFAVATDGCAIAFAALTLRTALILFNINGRLPAKAIEEYWNGKITPELQERELWKLFIVQWRLYDALDDSTVGLAESGSSVFLVDHYSRRAHYKWKYRLTIN